MPRSCATAENLDGRTKFGVGSRKLQGSNLEGVLALKWVVEL